MYPARARIVSCSICHVGTDYTEQSFPGSFSRSSTRYPSQNTDATFFAANLRILNLSRFGSLSGHLPLVFIDGLLQGPGLLAIHRAAHREAGAQDLFGGAFELLGQALLPHLTADVQEHLS